MENKLIPMVDFVLSKAKSLGIGGDTYQDFYLKISNYATFLKQSLKLGFFIPCDENDVPLVEPKGWKAYIQTNGWKSLHPDALIRCRNYAKAKENVLFEGFELKGDYLYLGDYSIFNIYNLCCYTVEKLIEETEHTQITLTPNALKQFEL